MKKPAILFSLLLLLCGCATPEPTASNEQVESRGSLPEDSFQDPNNQNKVTGVKGHQDGLLLTYYDKYYITFWREYQAGQYELTGGVCGIKGFIVEDYTGNASELALPEKANVDGVEAPIVGIGRYAFWNRKSTRKITLPDTCRFIDNYAFADSSVAEIVVSPHIKYFGTFCFSNSLIEPLEQNGIQYLPTPDSQFGYAYRLSTSPSGKVDIAPTCQVIGYDLFYDQAIEVNIPSSLHEFGGRNFGNEYNENGKITIESAKIVTTAESLRLRCDIPQDAFAECDSLRTVYLDEGCKAVAKKAFYNCHQVSKVYISKTVESIGYYGFGFNEAGTEYFCEAPSKPSGWHGFWNLGLNSWPRVDTVAWGAAMPG